MGCAIKGLLFNAFMYADDIILLSSSIYELQLMINFCVDELHDLCLTVNVKKCYCLRVGSKFSSKCCSMVACGIVIPYVNQLRFLGVYFKSGNKLKFNFEFCKQKFYASVNGILSKVGNKPELVLPLCSSFCLPLLLYATESMDLTSSEKLQLNWPYSKLFVKLFHVTDPIVIKQCQYYMYCLPISDLINLRTLNFLSGLNSCNNFTLSYLYHLFAIDSCEKLTNCYNISIYDNSYKSLIWNNFRECLA